MSHNSAPRWDWNPYMQWALRPLNPVVLLGVTGKSTEAPNLSAKFSVMQWWKAPSSLSKSGRKVGLVYRRHSEGLRLPPPVGTSQA